MIIIIFMKNFIFAAIAALVYAQDTLSADATLETVKADLESFKEAVLDAKVAAISDILEEDWSDVTSAKDLKNKLKALDVEDKDALKASIDEFSTEDWASYFENEEYATKFAEIKENREAKKAAAELEKAAKKAAKKAGKKAKKFGKKFGKK